MYHPQKLAIYLSSYHDGVGRKAGKTPSTSKLMGKWSAQVASVSLEKADRGPTLSGAPASIQAATKVNRCLSVVTKANDRTGFVGIREVEPVVSWRRLKSVWKQWLHAHTGSLGVKAGGMDTYTRTQTWDLPTGSNFHNPVVLGSPTYKHSVRKRRERRLGKSDEAIVVMMSRTLQPRRSEVPLLLNTFPHRKGDA